MSTFSYGFGERNITDPTLSPVTRGRGKYIVKDAYGNDSYYEHEPNVYLNDMGERVVQSGGVLRLNDGSLHPAYKGQPGSLVDNLLKKKRNGGQLTSQEQAEIDKFYASDPTRGLASVSDLGKGGRGRILPGSPGNSSNKMVVDTLRALSESMSSRSSTPVNVQPSRPVATWSGAVPAKDNVSSGISAYPVASSYAQSAGDILSLLGMFGLSGVSDATAMLRATGNGGSYLGNLLSKYMDEKAKIENEDAVNVAKRVANMQAEANKSMPSLTDMLMENVNAVSAAQNGNTLADQYKSALAVAMDAARNRSRNLSAGVNQQSDQFSVDPTFNIYHRASQQQDSQPLRPSQYDVARSVANVEANAAAQRAMDEVYGENHNMKRRMAGDDFMA